MINKKTHTFIVFLITTLLNIPIYLVSLFIMSFVALIGETSHTLSIYYLPDIIEIILTLSICILILFIPIIISYAIQIFVVKKLFKKIIINNKLFITLLLPLMLLSAIPYTIVYMENVPSYDIKDKYTRIRQEKLHKGYLVEGTDIYMLANRYLESDSLEEIKKLIDLDSLILTYEYEYIVNYLNDINFIHSDNRIKLLNKHFKVDSKLKDRDCLYKNKTSEDFRLLLNDLKYNDDIEEIKLEIRMFLNENKMKKDKKEDTNLETIITYELINLLDTLNYKNSDIAYIKVNSEINIIKYRFELYCENKKEVKEKQELYNKFIELLNILNEEDNLELIEDKIKEFAYNYNLNINNKILKEMLFLIKSIL